MAINTSVWANAANTESGKFVEIINDPRFPATSASTDPSFGPAQIIEYPKYAVLVKNIDDTSTNFTGNLNMASDAFGRTRMSAPLTLFDSSHRYADNNLWSTLTGGSVPASASATFNPNQGLMEMRVNGLSGSRVYRETTKVFSYQPGKSLQILNTFTFNPAKTNLRQRVGYFGVDNGIYLELDDSTLYMVERSITSGSLSSTRIPQSQWNIDKLDGAGPSGLTLDTTKAQIFFMDIEWLGVGTVRTGFVINGQFVPCHYFHHANIIDATYITTGSLPLRYEIENKAATGSSSMLKQICSTVISEGGYELRGLQQAVSNAITAPYNLITTTNTDYPVITIRLKSTKLDAIVILTALSILPASVGYFKWKIIAGGTTSGGAGTWTDAGLNSAVEYKQDRTSISGGRVLASGFISQTNQANPSIDILRDALFKFQLERNSFTGTASELTLVISADTATGGSPAEVFASLDWEEVSR
jgi:hypothetical protein